MLMLTLLTTGEWWKSDVRKVLQEMVRTGDSPNVSDAFTINGQPGHLYPCSEEGPSAAPLLTSSRQTVDLPGKEGKTVGISPLKPVTLTSSWMQECSG